jgi:catecholate siderophore receptor
MIFASQAASNSMFVRIASQSFQGTAQSRFHHENMRMKHLPELQPLAAEISTLDFSLFAPATRPASRRPALLPLGAMLAAMALSANNAYAQSPSGAAGQAAPNEAATLPTVDVKTKREETGYQGTRSQVGRTPELLRDIPQSVTVVTEQLIQDRNADTLKEALRNVAGLTFNAGEGGRIGDNITLRGYSLVGDLYLDGMRDIAQYNREIFNVEQVDVLRGSASMLFGRGSTGGVVNQVSKRPFLSSINEAAITIGSDQYKRGTADLNKVIGENAAIRLNVMKTDADSFRDGVHSERWGIAPSIGWGIGTKNEFNLSYYRLKGDNVPDFGVPYFQGRPLDVPLNTFYGMPGTDYQREDTAISTASWIHRFDNDTSLRTVLRKADYDRDLWAVAPRFVGSPLAITPTTAINRQAQRRGGVEHTLTSQTDFTTKLKTGGIQHQLLAGVELVREKANRWNYSSTPANPSATVGNPNPYPVLPAGYGDRTRISPVSYSADTVGVYAQDMISLTPHWKVLAGARHDDFKADYNRTPPAGPLSRTDRVWSYRTGLIYQPSDTQSYYASYGTSFNPSGELYALDDRTTNTPPEKNRNIEIGAKWDLLEGDLMFRTALFRSQKTNERNTDLANTGLTENLLSGKRHTDGIEFELAGRITPRWEIFGGLALMKATIDAATADQANTLGKTPLNTPDYTANVWSTYKLAERWKVGGGFEAAGKRYGNNTNLTEAPSYVRWDALLEYQLEKYAVKLNIFNLFNQKYYEGIYAGHVVPGTTRTAQLTLSTTF